MSIALAAILKSAASSILGQRVQKAVSDGVVDVVRQKLKLPPEADEASIDAALMQNPELYVQLVSEASNLRIAAEETHRVALNEQGQSERVALQSKYAFVRNARPAMLYMAGSSIFAIIIFGMLVMWLDPAKMSSYVDLVNAMSGPLSLLMVAGGVYTYRRSSDKAVEAGMVGNTLLDRLK